ncbi:histone acetylation protein-domain-containing protein [Ampelomyces quisqualis]|uniref:histone acetyltransferase n=1 Tax=Ampelomyces quisqualis TaxID=50730 RepID=A0A6A5QU18_AMPQU|nr:histone acetylation protein-domain-containing protein [Ampelomyces quisqualis]
MANTPTPKSLQDLLAEQLPQGVSFTFYHYSTPPTKSAAVFSAPPHAKPERTYCESHLLAASIERPHAEHSGLPEELLVLAIEVLIYTTRSLTTIFISKADSTGCLSELQIPPSQSSSPLKVICGTFVSWLARERQREGRKLVVSLFARAQDQYLFPASIDNKNKHVLDDRGLVKWWCRVLDPMVCQYKAEEERRPFAERLKEGANTHNNKSESLWEATAKGYLVIPGFDSHDTLRYTPPSPVPNAPRRWASTHPLLQIAPHPAAPPRCLVPHFPDDPKARFLDELDEELPDRGSDAMAAEGGTPSKSNGIWKSVKTLDQFWEFMAFRQECSSGRIVGFIWVVVTPQQPSIPEEGEDKPSQQMNSQPLPQNDLQGSERNPGTKIKAKRKTKSKTEYGPIPLKLPRIKQTSSNLSTVSSASRKSAAKEVPENSPYYKWPSQSRGTICFSTKDYNRAHEILIHQNFGTPASTAKATKRWRDEIAVLGGVDKAWGWVVTGAKEHVATARPVSGGTSVTTVMGVRKKRKPDVPAGSAAHSSEGIRDLGSDSVRKKPKIEAAPIVEGTNGVNTLTAGLVRKKPKV